MNANSLGLGISLRENQLFRDNKNELSDVLFSFKTSPQVGVTVGSGQMSPMSYPNSYSQSQQVRIRGFLFIVSNLIQRFRYWKFRIYCSDLDWLLFIIVLYISFCLQMATHPTSVLTNPLDQRHHVNQMDLTSVQPSHPWASMYLWIWLWATYHQTRVFNIRWFTIHESLFYTSVK
jgi:hypothetical protein